jgi:hypothetical protein
LIRVVCVAVIAGFDARLDEAVSASSERTTTHAFVGVDLVPVIALLMPWLPCRDVASGDAIAADCDSAAIGADVFLDLVPVITGFVARLELTEVLAPHAITAGCNRAVGSAGVSVVVVPVIAGFDPVLNKAVAAASLLASGQAGVAIFCVAVVAGFKARCFGSEIVSLDSVAAASHFAAVGAGVGVDLVSVVAAIIWIDDSVAADLGSTERRAAVSGVVVAVIATFKAIVALGEVLAQEAIATARLGALVGAGVKVASVAIITSLTFIDDRVAADLSQAGWRAAIARFIVAVIAFFEAFSSPLKPATHHTVAAASQLAVVGARIITFGVAIIAGFDQVALIIHV